ncbi:uncharacterized protein A4U43_C04F14230 [Asparagus officinalis]|uniref:Uncharacterized protein n=1 Tax=Asparagus officinalis TaxID=4686 RepID=A0A5P1F197_ASPOF|nr:uncharacterized protein A4U43_C04F14230 [Asparagus officinalis]
MARKSFYIVKRGRRCGIFDNCEHFDLGKRYGPSLTSQANRNILIWESRLHVGRVKKGLLCLKSGFCISFLFWFSVFVHAGENHCCMFQVLPGVVCCPCCNSFLYMR